uniref:C2 NT-type domain-containing protein n=1 Tax=Timspurckia oligopyrenoides TaxID=708627 RepID=A0A7S0ZD28_9RHOD|mmetsp:Transcript_13092/g.23551  ORF Transcript_13092/g.23551 Transcript_13092/m.23551 type:complete len:452 (+) Transcript_13092:30-1385(+)
MSKVLNRARSQVGRSGAAVSHLKLIPIKFTFTIQVHSLHDFPFPPYQGTHLYIVFQKRDHIYSANPVNFSQTPLPINQSVSIDLTLFTTEENQQNTSENTVYQEKDLKLAVRVGGENGKSVAKTHFDAAQWARAPFGSVSTNCVLSNGSRVELTVESKVDLSSVQKSSKLMALKSNSRGMDNRSSSRLSSTSSTASKFSGISFGSSLFSRKKSQLQSSVADDEEWLNEMDDIDDLLDDDQEQKNTTTGAVSKNQSANNLGNRTTSPLGMLLKENLEVSDKRHIEEMKRLQNELELEKKKVIELRQEKNNVRKELDKLEECALEEERKVRNKRLQKARRGVDIDDLMLDEDVDVVELEKMVDELMQENEALLDTREYYKQELEEICSDEENLNGMNKEEEDLRILRKELEKGEEFERVVEELKSAKLSLAISAMELDDAQHQLQNLRRKRQN